MDGTEQRRNRVVQRVIIAYLVVVVARFALELPADLGWIDGQSVAGYVRWFTFGLNVSYNLFLWDCIRIWAVSTPSGRRGKGLILVFLGLYMLAQVARQFGFFGWVESQGRIVSVPFFVIAIVVMVGLMAAATVLMVKALHEATAAEMAAKFHRRTPSDHAAATPTTV